MIYLTALFMFFFFFVGLLLMFLPGRLSKSFAIVPFIFELPLVASPQTVWADLGTGPLIVQVSLPAILTGMLFNFFLVFVFIAFVNFLEFDDRDLRPPFTKKPKKRQL